MKALKTFVIKGTEERELVIRETSRANATFLFTSAFPKADVTTLECDGDIVDRQGDCAVCNLPIFSDEEDVGADSSIHATCVDDSDDDDSTS